MKPCSQKKGVALILVLWALFVLAAVVIALARQIGQQVYLNAQNFQTLQAHANAFSGIQVAFHPKITNNLSPLLHHRSNKTHGYDVRIYGEAGKLNLNWLVVGENAQRVQILHKYLQNRGLTFSESSAFIDCLLDWVNPGDLHHANGSKTDINGQRVPGQPLQDLQELKQMKSSGALLSLPNWDRDFTLYTTGPVDLQWANEIVLASLPGVTNSMAETFIKARNGPDGVAGTADDMIFTDAKTALGYLGFTPENMEQIAPLIILKDPTTNVISHGFADKATYQIEAVVNKTGNAQPQILHWVEQ